MGPGPSPRARVRFHASQFLHFAALKHRAVLDLGTDFSADADAWDAAECGVVAHRGCLP